ncbi:hypothetical protein KP509_34G052900 [Ceratopteris richardii]|uniref:Uncharacterized protein n=1 Tax=Ceratopteris richardii TaxID=49495 RepID=A0A8T2QLF4_CERRI|nr:hypothetical protein KP509_34G052900 [Ceratopteris richardii]
MQLTYSIKFICVIIHLMNLSNVTTGRKQVLQRQRQLWLTDGADHYRTKEVKLREVVAVLYSNYKKQKGNALKFFTNSTRGEEFIGMLSNGVTDSSVFRLTLMTLNNPFSNCSCCTILYGLGARKRELD